MKIAYVILHYCVPEMTLKCVEKIRKCNGNVDYSIVIVDNASPDKSGKLLQKKYRNENDVTVILNKENLGFAKGNNIGCSYAEEVLNCNFICVLNNDVLLKQNHFSDKILEIYEQEHFAVLGPRIILKNEMDNPVMEQFPTREKLIQELENNKKIYMKYTGFQGELKWYYDIYVAKLKKFFLEMKCTLRYLLGKTFLLPEITYWKKQQKKEENILEKFTQKKEGVILHGCCLIFSPVYIDSFEEVFYNKTFLFHEEEILYLRCKEKNLKLLYTPEIVVKHLEDVSTDFNYRTSRKKKLFLARCHMESLKLLLDMIKN